MDTVIITLTNTNNSFLLDLEVPVDVTVEKLKEDLYEALNIYNPELYIRPASAFELYCKRLGVYLIRESTLRQEGVWNGDIIFMTEV